MFDTETFLPSQLEDDSVVQIDVEIPSDPREFKHDQLVAELRVVFQDVLA